MRISYLLGILVAVTAAGMYVLGNGAASDNPAHASPAENAVTDIARPVAIASLPPTPKAAIHALLRSADVPLSVHSSCTEAGTDAGDATIGEYLSGFLAELGEPENRNTVETAIRETQEGDGGEGWIVRIMIGQSAGEVEWRWGVEYLVRKQDGVVDAASFRCLGAG